MTQYLIPDDEDLIPLLNRIDDYLLRQVIGPREDDDWQLPAAVTGTAALDAFDHVYHPVHDGAEAVRAHRLAAPDGVYTHLPLAVVDLDEADVAVLRELDTVLQQAVTETIKTRELADLDELLDQIGEELRHELGLKREENAGQYLAGMLHRFLDVLAASQEPEAAALLARLAAEAGADDIRLTDAEEAAYKHVARRYADAIAVSNPALHLYKY